MTLIKFELMLFLLVGILSLGSQAAFVFNSCPEYSPTPFPVFHIWDEEHDSDLAIPTCQTAEDLSSVYFDIISFTSTFPVRRVFVSSNPATFSMGPSNTLFIAPRKIIRDHVQSLWATKVLFAHELGHGVFNELIREDWPLYDQFIKDDLEIMVQGDKFFKSWEKVDQLKTDILNLHLPEDEALINKIKDEINKISNEQKTLTDLIEDLNNKMIKNKMYLQLRSIISPYHEFFADLVGIFYANNPQAMYLALTYNGIDLELDNNAKAMDFTIDHPVETWNDSEVHNLLAPTRYFVWKNFLQDNMNTIDKLNFLLKIKDAIYLSARKRYDSENTSNITSTVVNINKDFIQSIKYIFNF